jgi:hypothetical protein
MRKEDDAFGEWVNRLEKFGWTASGGQLELPGTLNPANLTAPIAYLFLSDWESLTPKSVEWQVNVQARDAAGLSSTAFPPPAQGIAFNAGANFLPLDRWDSDNDSCVVCKIELGAGPNARTIFSDLRPGRFALGVQTRVRVSVARWFKAAPPPQGSYDIQSSVGAAETSDADPPTFSAMRRLNPGQLSTIFQPPGALWLDLSIAQGNTTVRIQSFDFDGVKCNDPAAPVCYPPSTPWPAPSAGSTFDVTNVGPVPAIVTVRWWVR